MQASRSLVAGVIKALEAHEVAQNESVASLTIPPSATALCTQVWMHVISPLPSVPLHALSMAHSNSSAQQFTLAHATHGLSPPAGKHAGPLVEPPTPPAPAPAAPLAPAAPPR